jgi:rhodanese-related sulfurtransferase
MTPEKALAFDPTRSIVLDVRNLGEYGKGHVVGSLNIPVDELRSRLSEVPRDKIVLVHCQVGFSGHLAVRILKENGYSSVFNITGGYTSMKALGGFKEEF